MELADMLEDGDVSPTGGVEVDPDYPVIAGQRLVDVGGREVAMHLAIRGEVDDPRWRIGCRRDRSWLRHSLKVATLSCGARRRRRAGPGRTRPRARSPGGRRSAAPPARPSTG